MNSVSFSATVVEYQVCSSWPTQVLLSLCVVWSLWGCYWRQPWTCSVWRLTSGGHPSNTSQSTEGTSVCWCLATHRSFPSDEWSYPGALPESAGVNQDATSFCLLRTQTWPLKQLRVWSDTAGHLVLLVFLWPSLLKVSLDRLWVGLLEALKTGTQWEKMICASLAFTFNLFIGSTPRLATGLLPSAAALWWACDSSGGELQWHFWFGFSPRWLSCLGFQTLVSVMWATQTSSPRAVFCWL